MKIRSLLQVEEIAHIKAGNQEKIINIFTNESPNESLSKSTKK